MLNRKVSIVLVVAIIIGLILFFVSTCHRQKKPEVIPVKVIIHEIEKSKDTSDKKIAILQKALDSEKIAHKNEHAKLLNSQAINEQLRDAMYQFMAQPLADTTGKDYTKENALALQLADNSKQSDSLCNASIENLNQQIGTLYKINYEKDTAYIRLKAGADLLAKNQEALQIWGNKLNRQFTGLKIGNKIWKGAAIVAGIYILKTVLIK